MEIKPPSSFRTDTEAKDHIYNIESNYNNTDSYYHVDQELTEFRPKLKKKDLQNINESILFVNPLDKRKELASLMQFRSALQSGNITLASSLIGGIDKTLIPEDVLKELIAKAIEDKHQKYEKEIKEIHKRSNRYIRDTRLMFLQMELKMAIKNADEATANNLSTNISQLRSMVF